MRKPDFIQVYCIFSCSTPAAVCLPRRQQLSGRRPALPLPESFASSKAFHAAEFIAAQQLQQF
jgi:hypothetical protein